MAAPMNENKKNTLLTDVHLGLDNLGSESYFVKGKYQYYHYICDGQDDRGWGCGYRTLQSLCSWINHQQLNRPATEQSTTSEPRCVPSIPEIQNALVTMGDKPATFNKSKEWIGSFEVCLCLDFFYNVPCKILHINSGKEFPSYMDAIMNHFKNFGSPVMMGGETDTSSKGILGVCLNPPALLVMDPHFYGELKCKEYLHQNDWVKWRLIDEFKDHSFYNLCLPQLKSWECN